MKFLTTLLLVWLETCTVAHWRSFCRTLMVFHLFFLTQRSTSSPASGSMPWSIYSTVFRLSWRTQQTSRTYVPSLCLSELQVPSPAISVEESSSKQNQRRRPCGHHLESHSPSVAVPLPLLCTKAAVVAAQWFMHFNWTDCSEISSKKSPESCSGGRETRHSQKS